MLNTFGPSPASIPQGGSVTWNWSSTNATACIVEGTPFNANGPLVKGPYQDVGTFPVSMYCTNPGGTSNTRNTSFTITPQSVAVAFAAVNTASLSTVTQSSLQTIPGTVTGTPLATITGSGSPQLSVNGGAWTTSSTFKANDTLRLRLTSPAATNGTHAATLTIGSSTVPWSVNTNVATPTANTFSASPSSIPQGGSVTWNWSSTNATACIVDGTSFPPNGPLVKGPYQDVGTSQVSMSCTGPGGTSNTLTTSFTVTAQPVAVAFAAVNTASLSTVTQSSLQTIPGTVTGTPLATITGSGSPQLSVNGGAWTTSSTFKANDTLRLRLTSPAATNGTHAATLTIGSSTVPWSVNTNVATPTANTFSASPSSIPQGGSVTWNWSSTNATACIVDGTSFPPNGPLVKGPYQDVGTSQVSMSCTGPGGTSNTLTTSFTVTPQPVAVAFDPVNTAVLGTATESSQQTIPSTVTGTPRVSIAGAGSPELSVNGGAWTTSTTFKANDTLKLRLTSPATMNNTNAATLTIGSSTVPWSVNTAAGPLPVVSGLTFLDVSTSSLGTSTISDEATISMTGTATATISGPSSARFSVNNSGVWVTAAQVNSGDKIRLQVNSAATTNATVVATITVGATSEAWAVVTGAIDEFPQNFGFINIPSGSYTAAPLNTLVMAPNEVLLTAFNVPVTATVSSNFGGTPEISINNGPWAKTVYNVVSGSKMRVRVVSRSTYGAKNSMTVKVGTNPRGWTVTTITLGTPTVSIPPVSTSNLSSPVETTVAVSGMTGALPVSVVSTTGGGNPLISVNGGSWTSNTTMNPGDTLKVKLTSSSTIPATQTATVTIGSVNTVWTVNTIAPPFMDITDDSGNPIPSAINIQQDERLKLYVFTAEPAICTASTVTAGVTKTLSLEVEGGNNGTLVSTPPNYFLSGNQNLTLSCGAYAPNWQATSSKTINILINPFMSAQTSPKPVINWLTLTRPGPNGSQVSVINSSFSMDTPLVWSWDATYDAKACYLDGKTYPYPRSGTIQLPPMYFPEAKTYTYGFFCEAFSGELSETTAITFTVTNPATQNTEIEPGFHGEYLGNVVSVNTDGKPDFYIYPAGNSGSGVAPFVMASSPAGYRFVMPNQAMALGASLTLDLGDFDADGHDDMIIKNLAQMQMDNVIVFAPDTANGIPGGYGEGQGYVQVDSQFKEFFDDLYNITVDKDYFKKNDNRVSTEVIYTFELDTWGICTPTTNYDINVLTTIFSMCNDLFGWWGTESVTVFDTLVQTYRIVRLENGDEDLRGTWHPSTNLLRCALWCAIYPEYPGAGGIFDMGEIVAGGSGGPNLSKAERVSLAIGNVLGRPFMGGVLDNPGWLLDDEVGQPGALSVLRKFRLLKFIRRMLERGTESPILAADERTDDELPANPAVSDTVKMNNTHARILNGGVAPDGTRKNRTLNNVVKPPPGTEATTGITVERSDTETVITVKARVYAPGNDDNEEFITAVEKYWEKETLDPSGHKYKMNVEMVIAEDAQNADIIINAHYTKASIISACGTLRPRACVSNPGDDGPAKIETYVDVDNLERIDRTYAHEFGHVIILGDLYVDIDENGNQVEQGQGVDSRPVLGHEAEIMGGGTDVEWYHMSELANEHGE